MNDIALRVDGLSKRYRLGLQDDTGGGMYKYKSLRDSVSNIAKRPLQTLKSTFSRMPMDDGNSFWALRDINFEIKKGEVVGIIGRNGAGKSTLLKILSRITKPTTGRVELFGRVGSLLEVGTGFHPELTGRENIYLNGAVLGMTQSEVKSKFDEIVAFSEIEKFLDTPVKQYSSGMYMRLAFAVAAHLEPEILVVDEVLAVGDAAFQKKCLGKMKDVANEGRTVLFVSHNMAQLERLCESGILLCDGTMFSTGDISDQISAYVHLGGQGPTGLSSCRVLPDLSVLRCQVQPSAVRSGSPCEVELELQAEAATRVDDFCILLCDNIDSHVAIFDLRDSGFPIDLLERQRITVRVKVDSLPLVDREYHVGVFARSTRGFAARYGITHLEIISPTTPSRYGARDRGFIELRYEASITI
ncbi:MAG: transporter ATP-binding protein [Phycisphaerales bacterium]|nr:transporter ATP-binding protein [Phycisphaerales bacterium]